MSGPRFLIVRLGAIGDCVMAVPVARSIKNTMPEAEIWWAIERHCSPVVACPQLVYGKVTLPKLRWRRWLPSTWRDQLVFFASLRKRKFDYGIDLQGHSKTAICLRVSGAKHRIMERATDAIARRLNPVFPEDVSELHIVDAHMKTLRSFGDFDPTPEWLMPDPDDVSDQLPAAIRNTGRLVTIMVGASELTKRYPLDRWGEIGRRLTANGMKVAYLGGQGEQAPDVPGTLDLVGKLPLELTMATIARSVIHYAADTAGGHIAAAYGVPVVSVFGPTPPDRYRPYGPRVRVLRVGVDPANVAVDTVMDAGAELLDLYGKTVSH